MLKAYNLCVIDRKNMKKGASYMKKLPLKCYKKLIIWIQLHIFLQLNQLCNFPHTY